MPLPQLKSTRTLRPKNLSKRAISHKVWKNGRCDPHLCSIINLLRVALEQRQPLFDPDEHVSLSQIQDFSVRHYRDFEYTMAHLFGSDWRPYIRCRLGLTISRRSAFHNFFYPNRQYDKLLSVIYTLTLLSSVPKNYQREFIENSLSIP